MNRLLFRRPACAWPLLLLLVGTAIVGCVEEVLTPAAFDVVLESTTFENRLRAPVIIYRNDVPLDTLAAGASATYPLNRKGTFRHTWRLISPFGSDGQKAGEEPFVDLHSQFEVRQTYRITNDLPGTNETIFTPLISNELTFTTLRLTVNYNEDDQRITSYLIPPLTITRLDSAPYYYWHSRSNVVLNAVSGTGVYYFTRSDTTNRQLRIDDGIGTQASLSGAGVTEILRVP
jgi:hypothetical protein